MNASNDTNARDRNTGETEGGDDESATRASGEHRGVTPPDGRVGHPQEPGFTEPSADRPPTAEESAVAERAAEDVDLEQVAEHYEQAMETGAGVRGEGQVTPDRSVD